MESLPSRESPPIGPDAEAVHTSARMRAILLALGWLFVALGGIGVVLPVVPTTPFLLLAAACFARSSPRLYRKLLDSRMFGPTIRSWRETRSIPRRVKLSAISLLAIVGGGSALFCLENLWARGLLVALLIGVATWIVRIPSTESIRARAGSGSAGD